MPPMSGATTSKATSAGSPPKPGPVPRTGAGISRAAPADDVATPWASPPGPVRRLERDAPSQLSAVLRRPGPVPHRDVDDDRGAELADPPADWRPAPAGRRRRRPVAAGARPRALRRPDRGCAAEAADDARDPGLRRDPQPDHGDPGHQRDSRRLARDRRRVPPGHPERRGPADAPVIR